MRRILNIFSSPTFKSTAVYYFGNFILSVFRYLFHLILLHFLAPSQYGEFLSYLSLIYLLNIPMSTISSLITKFVSGFMGKDDKKSINLFFYHLIKLFTPITLALGVLLITLSGFLSTLFKAHSIAFVILGVSLILTLYQTLLNSYLIAFQRFIYATLVGFLGVILTIIISVTLIKVGLGATGAIIGQILGTIVPAFFVFLNIKPFIYPKIKTKKEIKFPLGSYLGYSFLYALGSMSLISTDVLVVRVLFDPHTSGIYSALSILGRMILFGLMPMVSLVLPMASHRHAATGSAKSVFFKLGSVLILFGIAGAGIFSLFPSFIVKVLSGAAYLEAVPFLSIFAFTMVFFALSQFILGYLMATGKPHANWLLLIATIIQPLLFYFFRSTFSGVIWANLGLQIALCLSLFSAIFVLH